MDRSSFCKECFSERMKPTDRIWAECKAVRNEEFIERAPARQKKYTKKKIYDRRDSRETEIGVGSLQESTTRNTTSSIPETPRYCPTSSNQLPRNRFELHALTSTMETSMSQDEINASYLSYSVQSLNIGRPLDRAIIVMMGETGTGKSTTINNLFECEELSPTHSSTSATAEVTEYGILLDVTDPKLRGFLSLVDAPGTFDTNWSKRDRNFATVVKFRDEHPSLKDVDADNNARLLYPNLVLVTFKADDERIEGKDSFFNLTLKNIKDSNLVDRQRNNLIIVATHCASLSIAPEAYKKKQARIRNLVARLVYDVFDISEIQTVFIENCPEDFNLIKKANSDFYSLPDGELSHANLFSAISDQLKLNNDKLGLLLTSWYFKRDCPQNRETETPQILNRFSVPDDRVDHYLQLPMNFRDLPCVQNALRINRPVDKVMIMFMGQTGTGKSTMINKLFGCENLAATHPSMSTTDRVVEYGVRLNVEDIRMEAILTLVDVPGTLDTDEAQRANNFDAIRKFRKENLSLIRKETYSFSDKPVYPNLILVTVNASDRRIAVRDSRFIQTLNIIKESNLVDIANNNLMIVATHAASLGLDKMAYTKGKERITNLIPKLVSSVLSIPNTQLILVENFPENYSLEKSETHDFYILPDGELFHQNLFSAMTNQLKANCDQFGQYLTSCYFEHNFQRDKVKPQILSTVTAEVHMRHNTSAEIGTEFDNNLQIKLFGRGFSPLSETVISEKMFEMMKTQERNVLSKKCILPMLTVVDETEMCTNVMTSDSREHYEEDCRVRYQMESDMIINLNPGITHIGKWDVQNSRNERETIVSLVHEIRLVTIELDIRDETRSRDENSVFRQVSCTSNGIDEFFEIWGAFFVKRVSLGGSIQFDFSIPDAEVQESRTGISNMMSAFLTSLKQNAYTTENLFDASMLARCIKINTRGGDEHISIKNVEDLSSRKFLMWEQSIKSHPVELKFSTELEPFYKFVEKKEIKKKMRDATREYLRGETRKDETSKNILANKVINFVKQNAEVVTFVTVTCVVGCITAASAFFGNSESKSITEAAAFAAFEKWLKSGPVVIAFRWIEN